MAEAGNAHVFVPRWTWTAPVLVAIILSLKYSGILPKDSGLVLIASTALIGFNVFAAVQLKPDRLAGICFIGQPAVFDRWEADLSDMLATVRLPSGETP